MMAPVCEERHQNQRNLKGRVVVTDNQHGGFCFQALPLLLGGVKIQPMQLFTCCNLFGRDVACCHGDAAL